MITEKWFKVKYGFGVSESVSIQEGKDLEKAIYAQKFGIVTQIGNKQINGKYIISIEPNYHKYTGWYDYYEPKDGDDWKQIERDCPKDLNDIIRFQRERVDWLVDHNKSKQIGEYIDIPEIKMELEGGSKQPEVKKISDNLVGKFQL